MPDPRLSTEQQRALASEVRVIEAGPGSGKTRVLVARLVQNSTGTRQGVALLSFTNTAVDEVRRRTNDNLRLLQAPNFVGTIDSFLHRFVVTPFEVRRTGKVPTYLASWADLPGDNYVRLPDVEAQSPGIRLKEFWKTHDGSVVLPEHPNHKVRMYLDVVDAAGARQRLLDKAHARIKGLNEAGIMDSSSARVRALRILDSSHGDAILDRLGRRFSEILVDEAQDCDASEMRILEKLGTRTSVVLVADPDQAIYEFRGGDPSLFRGFYTSQPESARVALATNYRSTSSICSLVSSLRQAAASPILAADESACEPIVVFSGKPTEQGAKFRAHCERLEIPLTETRVLGHKASTIRAVVGKPKPGSPSTALGNRLAIACGELSLATTSPGDRLDAVRSVERILLALFDWPKGDEHRSRKRQLEHLGRDNSWLRQTAGQLVAALRATGTPEDFGRVARETAAALMGGLPVALRRLPNCLQKPDEKHWEQMTATPIDAHALPYETVHSSKGNEYPAVLLALPSSGPHEGLDAWEAGLDAETRRVLYVGASRAQRLLAVGAGAQAGRIAQLLRDRGVPVVVE